MPTITVGGWNTPISLIASQVYVARIAPAANARLLIEASPDGDVWTSLVGSPFAASQVVALPQGSLFLRAQAVTTAGTLDVLPEAESAQVYADAVASANSILAPQRVTGNAPCDVWRPGKAYAIGDRILPTAYNTPSTWTSGFVSAGGRLYQLVCIQAGLSSFVEPTWTDPATISNYSFNNGGGGAGQLDKSDNTVVWRIRPIAFIDPTFTGGSNNGSQLNPYTNYTQINATTGTAWGTVATDADNTGAGQLYASLMVLQRAGTTVTAAAPVLVVRGPSNGTADALERYNAGFVDSGSHQMRRRIFGIYCVPGDIPTKANLVGTGASATSGVGTITATSKRSYTIQDLSITNQRQGDNGYAVYQLWQATAYSVDVKILRCDAATTAAGHGFVATVFGGDSVNAGSGGLLYQDCNAYGIAGHGFLVSNTWAICNVLSFDSTQPEYSVRYERCKAWDIGRFSTPQAYNHGFSSIAARVVLGNGINNGTAGWTLVSGFVYNRSIAALTPQPGTVATISEIWGVHYRSELGVFPAQLKRNLATPTTPGVGEFGVSGGNLYVNLGALLDIRTQFNLQVSKCQDIQYEDCEAHHVYAWRGGVEGFGFAADEWSVASWRNCVSYLNGQAGLFAHFGLGCMWSGGQLLANTLYGAYGSGSISFDISDAKIDRNAFAGVYSAFSCTDTMLQHNVISNSRFGVVRFADPTNPPLVYPVNTYPYRSTVTGPGNVYVSCGETEVTFDLSTSYISAATRVGSVWRSGL